MAASGNILQWYAVESPAERLGINFILYVQATSSQQAGETLPGSTVLGGPYNTEQQAQNAYPQGSHGTRKSGSATPSNPPVVSDAPDNPLAAFEDVWDTLTSKNLWIRLGEGAVALILLDVGLKAFTGHSVIEVATKTGKTAAKGAATAALF